MTIPTDAGRVLLPLARTAIEHGVGLPARSGQTMPDEPWLREDGASFVTLHLDGRLRGCIGSLSPYRSLGDDVRGNARAAAFGDPRFRPVSAEEVPSLEIEVSVLERPEPMLVRDEDDLVQQLRPGVDGLVVEGLGRRATYLPQVWEQLPDPVDFVRQLKAKAGLPQDFWSEDLQVSRYGVTSWAES